MAKKKGKAGGKKGKKGAKVLKIAPETTKEMVQERELLKVRRQFEQIAFRQDASKDFIYVVGDNFTAVAKLLEIFYRETVIASFVSSYPCTMSLQTTGMPLGARYGLKRRADAIRLEVAGARLKSCMLKKDSVLSLRGLSLEECPEEFTKGVPPFEVNCAMI